ncbi:MAG: hypothetical protein ACOX34_06800 [Bacillota bacterium]
MTEITYDNKIKVDGKAFSASTDIDDLKDKVGKVVTLYLDKDGKIYAYEAPTPGAVYGVVQGIATRLVGKDTKTICKVLTLEGEVEYVWSEKTGGTEGTEGFIEPAKGAAVAIEIEEDGEASFKELTKKEEKKKVVDRDTTKKEIKVEDVNDPYTYTDEHSLGRG